jgi:hypothetical protein
MMKLNAKSSATASFPATFRLVTSVKRAARFTEVPKNKNTKKEVTGEWRIIT